MTDTDVTLTDEQVVQLRLFSIVSGRTAKQAGLPSKQCHRLVALGLLSETGTPRRYRLTHTGYLATAQPVNPATYVA